MASSTIMSSVKVPFLLLLLLEWHSILSVNAEQRCEVLKTALAFSQEKAPRDLSGVLPVVVERVNRVLEGVVNVEVLWDGADFHGLVGEHVINCKVTRLASVLHPDLLEERDVGTDDLGREVATQCFQVPFSISDTNECALPKDHYMHHQCPEPAICVNTIGSYECMCPRIDGRTPADMHASHGGSFDLSQEQEQFFWEALFQEGRSLWELSFNSSMLTSCPSRATTKDCCPRLAHSSEGRDCRARFHCPVDPCSSSDNNQNTCTPEAECIREASPQEHPNYKCQCPEGLMGNGKMCRPGIDPKPEPKITFDGHPTQETIKNDYYCGCTKPVVDACSGYPPCKNKHEVCVVGPGNEPRCDCKTGFFRHAEYGCVDETPPRLKLKNDPHNDQTLRLKQGDFYEEYGVEIKDVNAEDYRRSLRISYSEPLPKGCLTKIGEFHVNYTIAMPWTKEGKVVITRRVIIDDIDECDVDVAMFQKTCPELIPKCDFAGGAKCVNTVGSYVCECPKFTTGDGFQPGVHFTPHYAPEGFKGGTGCIDTSRPVIQLKGPNPKFFKICACRGLHGIMKEKSSPDDKALQENQRAHYEREIKEMIQKTRGAELCASHDNSRPSPTSCVYAFDETYKGKVDLSANVEVGTPVRKSDLHWSVPYNVKDEAGNHATTVYREVVVEEVDAETLETSIRKEMKAAKDAEIKMAVDTAVAEERRKFESDNKRPGSMGLPAQDCPPCPRCGDDSASKIAGIAGDGIDLSICDKICEQRAQQCAIREESLVIKAMLWFEGFLPASMVPAVLACIVLFGGFQALRIFFTLLFNPKALVSSDYDYTYDTEQERSMQSAVQYYPGGTPQHQQQPHRQTPQPRNTVTNSEGMSNSGGPPRSSLTIDGAKENADFFLSPRSANAGDFSPAGTFGSPATNGSQQRQSNDNSFVDPNDIYNSPPPGKITPRKGSDLRRRTPFSS